MPRPPPTVRLPMPGLISEEDIGQIRDRSDLVQVASDHVTLKKKGRLLWGLCPFHSEKTPSFKVDPQMQLWHCFGCGEGGNIFTFLMKIEHLEFPEAVEALADRVGYEIKREQDAGPAKSVRARLFEANAAAADHFALVLRRNPAATAARDYLKGRGFHIDLATQFKIGYAPSDRDGLIRHLASKKFTQEEMVGAGLAIRADRGLKDRFSDRIVFPIQDVQGRAVGFGGRAMEGGSPKYLNSPETAVYHKSGTLYGLFSAKSEIVKKGKAIVVEGYTDVIALHGAGFRNAVATCGTALTAQHIKLLGRFTSEIILVFDADAAGMAAAERPIEHISEYRMPGDENVAALTGRSEVDVSVAVLPEGQDPADLISTAGTDGFQEVLDGATGLVEFCIDRRIAGEDLNTPKGRISAAKQALAIIAPIASPLARDEFVRLIASRIGVGADSLALELKTMRQGSSRPSGAGRVEPSTAQAKAERETLRLALSSADMMRRVVRGTSPELFTAPEHERLYAVLSEVTAGKGTATPRSTVDGLEPELQALASGLLLDSSNRGDDDSYFAVLTARLKEFEVGRQIDRLKQRIESVNRHGNEKLYDSLFEELITLEARRRELKDEASGGAQSAHED